MKKKAIAILVASTLIMSCAVGLTGCGSSEKKEDTATTAKFTGTKIFKTTNGKVKTINPHTYQKSEETDMFGNIYEGFYTYLFPDKGGVAERVPSMAKEIPTISEDKLTCTVKLRDGLKFTDGKAIDAETYMYSFKMLLDPKLKNYRANSAWMNITIKNAKSYYEGKCKWEDVGIKSPDKNTLVFTLELVTPIEDTLKSINGLAWELVHPDLYEKGMNAERTETKYGTTLELTASYGAYTLKEWNFDQSYKLEKNKDYMYASKMTPDIIDTRVVEEDPTKLQLFEGGELDEVTKVPVTSFAKYAEDPRLAMEPGISVNTLNINSKSTTNPILKDANFRKAMFYGLDRQKIAKDILKTAHAATFIVPEVFTLPIDGKVISYRDTEVGKSVIAKNNGFDTKIAKEAFDKAYEANGNKKITVTLQYVDSSDGQKNRSEFMKNSYETQFGKDKFELKLQAVPSQVFSENMNNFKYEMGWWGWTGGLTCNACAKMNPYSKSYPKKNDTFENDEFEKLYERTLKGDLMFKEKEKLEALGKMEKMILDDMSIIPVFEMDTPRLYSDKIKFLNGGKYDAMGGFGITQAEFTR